MGIRAIILGVVVAGCTTFVWAAEEPTANDWGARRVKVEERFTGPGAGRSWNGEPRAGIALARPGRAGEYAILDYEMGWTAEEGQGAGVAGMLEGEWGLEERLQVLSFGRKGGQIALVMVVHPAGGVLPEWGKYIVRQKMGAGSQMPVSIQDARAAGLQGKKIALAGMFPEDLPAGEYQVVAELRDEAGLVKERYQKQLVKQEKDPDSLQSLADAQLLQEYVKRGEALRGTGVEPVDSPVGVISAAYPYDSPPSMAWKAMHQEIVRRRKQMVPMLLPMLEKEAVRNPGEMGPLSGRFGFAFDLMRMLEEIGDSRPVPLLVRIMEGMDGKANVPVRERAEEVAEGLTFISFDAGRTSHLGPQAVLHDGPLVQTDKRNGPMGPGAGSPNPGQASALFAQWLAGEGRDPARWLPLARARARKALEGTDPVRIGNAIQFLTGGYWGQGHDDQPEVTMQAIARFLDREDRNEIESKANMPLPGALAHCGPAARRYVGSIIDEARQRKDWSGFMDLMQVGGEQAVAYMVEALPKLRKDVEALGLDLNVDRRQLQAEAAWAVSAYRACRWGIERWAGRVFDTDKQIAAWWEQAKAKSQRQWLEESLKQTSIAADQGSAKAQYLLRCMLPDLPNAEGDLLFLPPWQYRDCIPYRENAPAPYRERWLSEHGTKLVYDDARSCFRLGK